MERKIKSLVLLTVFIDIIGLGIVIPVLPFYVQTFSSSPVVITTLFSVYALCSFLSAPWIGALSDRYGRRPALITSIGSTAVGWFIFASAPTLLLLFVGRIVDGLAAGNLPVAQSALVDLAKDEKERAANLGLVGAIFGIGFIVGPFLGGMLGHFGPSIPFWFVGVLSAINTVLAYFFLPETKRVEHPHVVMPVSANPFAPLWRATRNKALRVNYTAIFLFGMATAGIHSIFSLAMHETYGFSEFTIGLIFSGVGCAMAFNQAFLMRRVWLKHFSEASLQLWVLLVLAFGYGVLAFPGWIALAIGLIIMPSGSILHVVMNSQVVSKAPPQMRGEVLGITTSVISLAAGISPIAIGALYAWHEWSPWIASSLLLVASFLVLFTIRAKAPRPTQPELPLISPV